MDVDMNMDMNMDTITGLNDDALLAILAADHSPAGYSNNVDFVDFEDDESPIFPGEVLDHDDQLDFGKFDFATPPFRPVVSELTPPPTQEKQIEADLRDDTPISPSQIDPALLAPPSSHLQQQQQQQQQQQHRSLNGNLQNNTSHSASSHTHGTHGHDVQPLSTAAFLASDGFNLSTSSYSQISHHGQDLYQYQDPSEQYQMNPGGPAVFLTHEERRARDEQQLRRIQEQQAAGNGPRRSQQYNANVPNLPQQRHHVAPPGPQVAQHLQEQRRSASHGGAQYSHLQVPTSRFGSQMQPPTLLSQPERQPQNYDTQRNQNQPFRVQQLASESTPNIGSSNLLGSSPYGNSRLSNGAAPWQAHHTRQHLQQSQQAQHLQPNGNAGSNGTPGTHQHNISQNSYIQQRPVQGRTNGLHSNLTYINSHTPHADGLQTDDHVNGNHKAQQWSQEPDQSARVKQNFHHDQPQTIPNDAYHHQSKHEVQGHPEPNIYKKRAAELDAGYPGLDWAPPLSTLLEPVGWHESLPPVDGSRVEADKVAFGKMVDAAFMPSLQLIAQKVHPNIRANVLDSFKAVRTKIHDYLEVISRERKQIHDAYMAVHNGQQVAHQLDQKHTSPITAQNDQQLNVQVLGPHDPIGLAMIGEHDLTYSSYQQGAVLPAKHRPVQSISSQASQPAASSLRLSQASRVSEQVEPQAPTTVVQDRLDFPAHSANQVNSLDPGNNNTDAGSSAGPAQEAVSAPAAGTKRKRAATPRLTKKATKPASAKQTKENGKATAQEPAEDTQGTNVEATGTEAAPQATPSTTIGGDPLEKAFCKDYPNCNHKNQPVDAPRALVNKRNWYISMMKTMAPIDRVNLDEMWLHHIGLVPDMPIPGGLRSGNYTTVAGEGVPNNEEDDEGEEDEEDDDDDEDADADEDEEAGPPQSKKRRVSGSATPGAGTPAKKQRKGRKPPGDLVEIPHFMSNALVEKGLPVYTQTDLPAQNVPSKE